MFFEYGDNITVLLYCILHIDSYRAIVQ